jgi:1-acyl-sn-glycerol-3-phosphate acyltransferase
MVTMRRRMVSIPGVMLAALLLVVLAPVWIPLAIIVDLAMLRWRLPTTRLLLFGLCWSWLETFGVAVAGALWLCGQRRNARLHYRLQAWWAASLMSALQVTTGVKVFVKVDGLAPGPAVVLCRHASLADSLLSAWAITAVAKLRPRYVLKRELLWDPCLDIVGGRIPNYFLDRGAPDSAPELDALRRLGAHLGDREVAVIFPEGTRSSPAKRRRALDAIARSQPQRSQRMAALRHLLPPRPSGTLALLEGAGNTDVVFAWHSGFDGLDTFDGILRHLARRPPPVRFAVRRVAAGDVPGPSERADWLDEQWLQLDRDTHALIALDRPEGST